MILTEHEAKQLLRTVGIATPPAHLIHGTSEMEETPPDTFHFPVFVKAQVLHGDRMSMDLVIPADSWEEVQAIVPEMLERRDRFDNPIDAVLLESAIQYEEAFYLAIRYDTVHRQPVLELSVQAGTGIEVRADSIESIPFSAVDGPTDDIVAHLSLEDDVLETLHRAIIKLWQVYATQDATLVEVNPFVIADDGTGYCLDAKIELEDTASFRHQEWKEYGERSPLGRPPTERETQAHEVSRSDHRGVAGESFFEFPEGTIGVMASGGGASTLAMDALLTVGLKPANYTEYSGNPTREKTSKLADVVLSMDGLEGLYVVGSTANFTDIYETLAGVLDGLLRSQYAEEEGFALVIRRGGPRWEEAFEMIRERLADSPIEYRLYGPEFPITETAAVMKELIR